MTPEMRAQMELAAQEAQVPGRRRAPRLLVDRSSQGDGGTLFVAVQRASPAPRPSRCPGKGRAAARRVSA